MPMTNYILTPEDVDLIRQAVEKVLGRSISYAGQIALENLTNTDDLRNNMQIIIGESLQSGAAGLTITFDATTGITTLTLDPDLAVYDRLNRQHWQRSCGCKIHYWRDWYCSNRRQRRGGQSANHTGQ